jgi:hypothetical protein
MNSPIDAPSTQKGIVGSIDYGINFLLGYVTFYNEKMVKHN